MQAKWIPRPNFNVEEEGKTRNEGKLDTKADAEDGKTRMKAKARTRQVQKKEAEPEI